MRRSHGRFDDRFVQPFSAIGKIVAPTKFIGFEIYNYLINNDPTSWTSLQASIYLRHDRPGWPTGLLDPKAFSYFHKGMAPAMAWGLFMIIIVPTGINFPLRKNWGYHETDGTSG